MKQFAKKFICPETTMVPWYRTLLASSHVFYWICVEYSCRVESCLDGWTGGQHKSCAGCPFVKVLVAWWS